MSLLKTIKAQLGLSGTPANNFTLDASAANGTMKLARGNAGATTQDIMTVAADGKVAFPATPATPRVYLPGEVIQQLNTVDNGSSTASNLWVNTTTGTQSIVPKSTNSKIIVEVTFQGLVSNAASINTEAQYFINEGGAFRGSQMNLGAPSAAGNTDIIASVTMRAVLPNASLASRAFLLFANCPQSVLIGATAQYWKITEVQN